MEENKLSLNRSFTGYDQDKPLYVTATGEEIRNKVYDVPIDKTFITTGKNKVPLDTYMDEHPFDKYYLQEEQNPQPGISKYSIAGLNPYSLPKLGHLADTPGNDSNGGFNNGLNNLMVAGIALPRVGMGTIKKVGEGALKLGQALLPSGWANTAVANNIVSSELAPTITGLGYAGDIALAGPLLYDNIKEGNYADAALEGTLLYTPVKTAASNALHNLGLRARNAAYYNILPFGYGGKKLGIQKGIKDFFNPAWKFDYTKAPAYINDEACKLFVLDMELAFRDLAWRKAMRIPNPPGVPDIYKLNADGTYSYDYDNINKISKHFRHSRWRPTTVAPSEVQSILYNIVPLPKGKYVSGLDVITRNGGYGMYYRLPNNDVVFTDTWDVTSFRDHIGRDITLPKYLPKFIKKRLENLDVVSAIEGDPFKVKTVLPYVPEHEKGGALKQSNFNNRIHINPKNKGKFNETKKRTGKTTEELTHSKNKLTRKRAIFAQNASKWNHTNKVTKAKGGVKVPPYMRNYGMDSLKFKAMFNALRLKGLSNQVAFETTWQSMKELPKGYYAFGKRKNNIQDWADSSYTSLTSGGYKAAHGAKNFYDYRKKTFKYNTSPSYTEWLLEGRDTVKNYINKYIEDNNLGAPIAKNILLDILNVPDYSIENQDNILFT